MSVDRFVQLCTQARGCEAFIHAVDTARPGYAFDDVGRCYTHLDDPRSLESFVLRENESGLVKTTGYPDTRQPLKGDSRITSCLTNVCLAF